MNKCTATFILVGFFVWAGLAQAEMTSTNYKIRWDSISTGGSDTASSTSYILRDTVESAVAGRSTSTSYIAAQGYREGVEDQIITFDLLVQDLTSGVTPTGLSSTTITVATAGFAVDDYIILIQDEGASQVSAIGKITSIGAGTITVDELKDGGTAPTIDGSNDVVYQLDGSSLAFGDLSESSVATAIVGFEVTAETDNGYVVQVFDDGNLRDGANDIDDVADGTVTAGAEEYGGRSSDTSLADSTFDSADTGFTTSFTNVATESSASFASRNFVTIKAAMSSASSNGSYAHTLSFIASGNF